MEIKTKQRLVGILVLLAILAIFLPVLFHTTRPSVERPLSIAIPPRPEAPKVALSNADTRMAAATPENEQAQLMPTRERRSETTQPIDTASPTVQTNAPAAHTPAANEPAAKIVEQAAPPAKPIQPAKPTSQNKTKAKKLSLNALLHSPKAWVVQLGTFGEKANADRLISELRKKGFDAYVRPITKAEGTRLYRVYVGPEIRLGGAQKLQEKLQASYHLHGVVRKYKI